MKKILSALILVSFLAVPIIIHAVEEAPLVFETTQGLINLINTIGNWLFAGILSLSAVFLIYSGFLFVTAQGDPGKVGQARDMLKYCLIGVVVAVAARGLVAVVQSILGA